jgi:probable O-glycosylation ligase (exosortase A-associated)
MGRINAWWMAWNLAVDRPLGGGYDIYWPEVFARYAPVPDDVHAAHSIYFQVLGEHGFVGLGLFLLLWIMAWRTAGYLRRTGPMLPATRWTADLGAMTQASLAGYAVGGAFLSLAYFDLPYNLMLLVVLARQWVAEKGWEREAVAAPSASPTAAMSPPVST